MAYQGWNREELLAAGSVTGGSLNIKHHTTTSFTPIIHNPIPLPPLSLLDPLGRGLEGDSLYELREEPACEIPANPSKKRKPVSSKGRGVSLGAACEYEDEEDIRNNAVAFEGLTLKRKKTTIAKRSQSMRAFSMSTAQLDNDGHRIANQDGQNHKSASRLTIPPESDKRKNGKAGSMTSKNKAKQILPFKNPTITKASISRQKEPAAEIHRPLSIISHNGWRSTEASVKFTSVVLAKTTMEKLAAFRFKPVLDPQIATITPPALHKQAVEQDDLPPHKPLGEPSSDYDLPSDSFFDEALWTVKAHREFNSSDRIQPEPVATPNLVTGGSKSYMQHRRPAVASAIFGSQREPPVGRLGRTGPVLAKQQPSTFSQDCYEPTSSEACVFGDLAITADPEFRQLAQSDFEYVNPTTSQADGPSDQSKAIGGIDMEVVTDVQEPRHVVDEALHSHQLAQVSSVEHHDARNCSAHNSETCERPNGEVHCMLAVAPHAIHSSQNSNLDELPKRKESFTTHQAFRTSNTDIQVERSDVDEPEMLSKDASRDLWGSNEFDQGLGDDDLLAIVSDNVIPQTPVNGSLEKQKNARVCGRFLLPSIPSAPDSRITDAPTPQNPTTLNISNADSSSPWVIADPDDEFPMDNEDEEEMLKLSELGAGVKGSFPPESVQQEFHLLEEAEVFDSSLQLSPPKPRAPDTSLSRVTQGHHIDKARTSQSPGLRKDSLPTLEEEDWSFIHSDEDMEDVEAHIIPVPFCEPQTLAVRPTRPRQASSAPTSSVAGHDNNRTPDTQMTSDTSCLINDDSHEFEPMMPFARPDFPGLVMDRSPVVGLSAQTYLRTCFRIGEMFKEGVRCGSLAQDAVIELFARVTFSSRETGSTRQHFQFADLWHDRPPYPNGLLANYKTTGLAESESEGFLNENGKMARCLGRFKRDVKNSVWVLHIINIRETDWEEIRWTKEIVSHGQVKTEKGWFW